MSDIFEKSPLVLIPVVILIVLFLIVKYSMWLSTQQGRRKPPQ